MSECACDPRLGDSCRCETCHVFRPRSFEDRLNDLQEFGYPVGSVPLDNPVPLRDLNDPAIRAALEERAHAAALKTLERIERRRARGEQ